MDSLQNTLSTWYRNTTTYVSSGGDKFTQHLAKACYAGDDLEPKEKHVEFLRASFEGKFSQLIYPE